ncbi:hypothetical protein HCN51_29550 [Nonomuraea sp. FMUSA5-5]|uniref:Permease n=1 Tax=Nonomuraea composti TaxID=2720023 RepID=A0ABX1BEI2_9ACTN|nr:hypothetical protein [Nonomuraea sp. FMUSA5-5]NJP93543.1 hypothetical protein [Nonomuraea sp. FMUSA5-5]
MDWPNCPSCGVALTGTVDACPECRLLLHGPAASDYLNVVAALAELDGRRAELVRRREEALAGMRAATDAARTAADAADTADAADAASVVAGVPVAGEGVPVAVVGGEGERGPRRDLSHRAVQNVLLLLGGTLLSIAAVVFTLVSWQVPALRALILTVFTVAVLAAPWLLVRRRLVATAETVALLGLVLIPLDGVAVMQVFGDGGGGAAGPEVDSLWGWAVAAAALSLVWAVYAWWAPLRLPTPVAIVLAQVPLPLAALAEVGSGPLDDVPGLAGALVVDAAVDLVLWGVAGGAGVAGEYVTTAVAGAVAWVGGVGVAAFATVVVMAGDGFVPLTDPRPVLVTGLSPGVGLVLGGAAVVAVLWAGATRGRGARLVIGAGGALAGVGAGCALTASVVPGVDGAAVAACAAVVVLVAALWLPVRLRDGVRTGGALVLGVAACSQAQAVIAVALGPLGWLTSAWGERAGRASELLGPDLRWDDAGAAPVVMAAVAVGSALVPAGGEVWTPDLRRMFCLVSGCLAVVMAPVSVGLGYEVGLGVVVVLASLLMWRAAARRPASGGGGAGSSGRGGVGVLWVGGCLGGLAMCWGLADRTASVTVAGVLAGVWAGCAVAGRTKGVQAVGGAGATVAAGVMVWGMFGSGMAAAVAMLGVRAGTLVVTRPSRKLAAAVVRAGRTGTTLALGSLDRLTRLVRPGGRTAAEAAAMVVALLALAQYGFGPEHVTAGEGLPLLPGRLGDEVPALLLAVGAVLAAASAWRRPRGSWRTVAAVEACLLAVLAPLPLSGAVVPALVGPYGWLTHAWAGAAEGARAALSPAGPWQAQPLLMPVLVLAGAAGALAVWARWGRPAAMGVAGIAFPVAATALPVVADLPYWAALAFLVALTAGLALWSAASRSAAGGASLWTATLAVSWSLADRTATLAVLAAIAVTALLCAVRGKGSPVTSVAATVTGLAVGAESVAAALGGGLGRSDAALVLLLVIVLLSRAAALPVLPAAVAGPLGAAALALWPVAMLLARDVARLSLVLAAGGLALAASAWRLKGTVRPGAYALAGAASAVAVLPHVPVWAEVLGFPYQVAGRPWRELLGGWVPRPEVWDSGLPMVAGFGFVRAEVGTALGAGVFAVATAVIVARRLRGDAAARSVATVAVPVCLVLVPPVAELAYPWVLIFHGVVLVALAVQASAGAGAAGVMALLAGGHVVAWSLDVEAYTVVVLAGITLLGVAASAVARGAAARTGAAASATVAAGGLAAASALSAGLRVEEAAFAVLGVAAVAVLAAARLATLRRAVPGAARTGALGQACGVAEGAEVAGWGVAVAGVVMTGGDRGLLSLALACAGVLALVVALRPDRRAAVWAGLGLLQVALWLRLALSGVVAPEAYTVPLSVAGLVGAWLARRRDPGISSWSGYGLALALTFLPSAYAAWHDPGLARPLLLGVAAFAATLAGARARLQAPLILGGAVLVVTAAHEFAPALAELVGQGPRWVPIAVAGAFLLFTGATYEHRLRDLRKIRRLIVRMR